MSEVKTANKNSQNKGEEERADADVQRCGDVDLGALVRLLDRYGLRVIPVADDAEIPGSYWGAPEAGLQGTHVYIRRDTPVHSVLHEACHVICMTEENRRTLDTNAGNSEAEENAVCFLQILLADELPGIGRERLMTDMDRWGYSFRLGSTRAWFRKDADDANRWLQKHGIIDRRGQPTWKLRHLDEPE